MTILLGLHVAPPPPMMTARAIADAVLDHVLKHHRAPSAAELSAWIDYRHPCGKDRTLEAFAMVADYLLTATKYAPIPTTTHVAKAWPTPKPTSAPIIAEKLIKAMQDESATCRRLGEPYTWNKIRNTLVKALS